MRGNGHGKRDRPFANDRKTDFGSRFAAVVALPDRGQFRQYRLEKIDFGALQIFARRLVLRRGTACAGENKPDAAAVDAGLFSS